MSKQNPDAITIATLFNSFRESLSIPSREDFENLQTRLNRIEELLLKNVFQPQEPVQEVVEKEVVKEEVVEEEVVEEEVVEEEVVEEEVVEEEVVKEKVVKEKVVKTRKPASKPKRKESASDIVLAAIASHKQGADFKKIKESTDFDDKKLRNIIFRLGNTGRIKRVKRGIYKAV